MKKNIKNILIKETITIKEAMNLLNKTGLSCLLVENNNRLFLGTLSDGDLRRSILSGADFDSGIKNSYNNDPKILKDNDIDYVKAKKWMKEYKIYLIPVIDKNNCVVDYITWDLLFDEKTDEKKLNAPVVIMAGGKGIRMQPFTKVLPKPLLPIHDKPIIEHIIERFTVLGCKNIFLTVNFKGSILKAYFKELNPNYSITFIDEKDPLGTAGSLKFLENKLEEPFFVTNCDILVKANYNKIYNFHNKNNFDVTLVASTKEYIIPYGTCKVNNDGSLSHIDEKPKYDFLINTGLYILNPDVLRFIPKNKFYHITHLIEDLKNSGKKIGVYPVDDESWIDVGEWKEYKKVVDQL